MIGGRRILAGGMTALERKTEDALVNWTEGPAWLTANYGSGPEGLCYSPELGLFVTNYSSMSSSAHNPCIARSSNGLNWTAVSVSAVTGGSFGRCICWSPELRLFCAGILDGTILTSPDAVNWTSRGKVNNTYITDVCWSPELGLFCAVWASISANQMTCAISPNGINWTPTNKTTTLRNWQSVCWSPELGLFCAIGDAGFASTSPDGVNWTLRTWTTTSTAQLVSICWSPKLHLFCAVGNAGSCITSPDGINWTERTMPSTVNYTSVCWSPQFRLFFAAGDRTNATSRDGVNWEERPNPTNMINPYVCWLQELGLFCVVGRQASPLKLLSATSKPV